MKPRSLKPLAGIPVASVVAGPSHVLAVTLTSQVYAWGGNDRGQLGLGDTCARRAPTLISGLWGLPVTSLAVGGAHSAALTANGFLFTWGDDASGQLGLPAPADAAAAAAAARAPAARAARARAVNQRFLSSLRDMGVPTDRAELALAETGNVGVEVAAEWLFSVPEAVVERALAGSDSNTPRDAAGASGRGGGTSDTGDAGWRASPSRVPLQAVVAVAAGGKHTLAATADGGVWAWGDNAHGQCGVSDGSSLSTTPTVRTPTRLPALEGVIITSLAAGTAHSLALTDEGCLCGWGAADGGALPGAPPGEHTLPTPTRLTVAPLLAPRRPTPASCRSPTVVATIVAAGDASALLTRAADEPPPPPPPSLADRLTAAIDAAAEDAAGAAAVMATGGGGGGGTGAPPRAAWPSARFLKPILSAVDAVFGSAAALSTAFGTAGDVGIDVVKLDAAQRRVLELYAPLAAGGGGGGVGGGADAPPPPHTTPPTAAAAASESIAALCAASLHSSLFKAANTLLDDLHKHAHMLGTPERAQALLAAAQSPLLAERATASVLVPRLCNTILLAPPAARRVLVRWWSGYPPDLLRDRVVAPLQSYLTDELAATKKLTLSVMAVIKVLADVHRASGEAALPLPPDAFYNELISDKLDVEDHYVAWRQTHDAPAAAAAACAGGPAADGPFSFCSYPFLLNPRAKSKLLHTEARFLMTQTVHQARIEHVQSGRGGGGEGECVVPAKGGGGGGSAVDATDLPPPTAPRSHSRSSTGGSSLRSLWSAVWRGARVTDEEAAVSRRPPTPQRGYLSSTHPHRTSSSAASTPRLLDADAAPARLVGGALAADERAAAARELTVAATRAGGASARSTDATPAGTPSAAAAEAAAAAGLEAGTPTPSPPLRHGSMNLPPPAASGVPATHPDMCIVRVRRCHLVEDGLAEIARQRPRDLLKPLRVHFIGEDGIDAGGVKKEFFQLLVTELLSPDYGMLVYLPESRTYWFNAASLEGDDEFMLVGLVLGLAIYNAVLLDFPLPIALYRKLLGQAPTLRDLEAMEPTLAKSLRQLLTYEGPVSVEDVFCASFVAAPPGASTGADPVDLVPGGASLPVTEANRRDYVDAYVAFYLTDAVHAQFEAFARGFAMLAGGPAIHLFTATELERLVCGSPVLDFGALRKAARYDGGYTADSRAVVWLWQEVADFTPEEERRFLKFFTGSDRAPIGGLGALRTVVQRDGPDSAKLPTSHTCFNTLLLPDYASREALGDRLRLAIMNSEGFGLE